MTSGTYRGVARRARILIVDDHPLVREGLASRIDAQPDLGVCGQAGDFDEALELVARTRPDLVIVDLALKHRSGLDLIKRLHAGVEQPRMLVVSAYDESLFAERALRAGAHGYVNKQELQDTILTAIRTVLRGSLHLSTEMGQRLAGQALGGGIGRRGMATLTNRELQVFSLIGTGVGTRQIAEQLNLSVHTIESHRERIRQKLQLHNGVELMQRAVQWVLDQGEAPSGP